MDEELFFEDGSMLDAVPVQEDPIFYGSNLTGALWADPSNPLDVTAVQLADQTAYVMDVQAESYRVLTVALLFTLVVAMRFYANRAEGFKGVRRFDRWVLIPAMVFSWIAWAIKRGQLDQSRIGLEQMQATLDASVGL